MKTFCYLPEQESEHSAQGPANHCPPHCFSLEQSRVESGFELISHVLLPQTAYLLCIPVPHSSEHLDHSVTSQGDISDDSEGFTVRGWALQLGRVQYSAWAGLVSAGQSPNGHDIDLERCPVPQETEHWKIFFNCRYECFNKDNDRFQK